MSHQSPEKKLVTCKNCGNSFHGAYCNACGQDAHTGKIDKHFLYHEVQHGLLHIDKGILYTIKELFTRPGHAIREFIQGKRVRHFKPLSFLIVMVGLYVFINHYFNTITLIGFRTPITNANNTILAINELAKNHYILIELLQLPIIAYACYIIFKKYGTNYMEQLVINTYLMGQRIIIKLVLVPLPYFFAEASYPWLYPVRDIVVPLLLMIWAYRQYYNTIRGFTITYRAVLAYIVNYILVLIIVSIILSVAASFPKLIA